MVEHTDEARRDYIQRYFHHDIHDAHLYDLVINLAYLSLDDAVDLIAAQCERRFASALGRPAGGFPALPAS